MERKDTYAGDAARWNPYQTPAIDYLVKLAADNVTDGVLEEPRVYFDLITLPSAALAVRSHENVFTNGERYPVRLTHMTMALQPTTNVQNLVNQQESLIQRVGLRLQQHDNFYQAADMVAAPLWANKVCAAPTLTGSGVSSYEFPRPVVLSARDALSVEVNLLIAPPSSRRVSVAFTGVGMLSKRPYFFSSATYLMDTNKGTLPIEGLRNDGAEPVALTDMTINCGADTVDLVAVGDIRQLFVQVSQVGNGTQANWLIGSVSPVISRCPAVLLGKTAGRCIVHEFPGQGLLWEPGEGVTVEAMPLDLSTVTAQLAIALHGYIVVT